MMGGGCNAHDRRRVRMIGGGCKREGTFESGNSTVGWQHPHHLLHSKTVRVFEGLFVSSGHCHATHPRRSANHMHESCIL
jgi:hypothetical protein